MFEYDEIIETIGDVHSYECNHHPSRLRLEVWLAFAGVMDGEVVLQAVKEHGLSDSIWWCYQAVAYIVTAVENGDKVDMGVLSTIEDNYMTVATWNEWRHMVENVERWAVEEL